MTDTTGSEPTPRKSLDEIAAMMAENTMKMRGQKPQPQPNEVTDDEDQGVVGDEGQGEETDGEAAQQVAEEISEGGEEGQEDALEHSGDDEGHADEDEGAAAASDELSGDFEIDDETLFELDEDNQVSFADLKKVYENNRDNAELLETTRAASEEALVDRQKAVEQINAASQAAMAVFEHFENMVSQPYFSKPDSALKNTNPQQYIQHLEAYEQDQERIAQNKKDLQEVFQQHIEKETELKNSLKKQVVQKVADLVPQLKSQDAEVRKTASTDIIEAANHYGFSQAEVNEATDPRLYQMAHDAQQYRKLMAKTRGGQKTVDKEEKTTKVRNQTKTLRSRGTTSQQRLSAKAKVVRAAKEKAQSSGKVDDVADFIAANKRS